MMVLWAPEEVTKWLRSLFPKNRLIQIPVSLFFNPFTDLSFHFMHMNIMWVSGIVASVLCCIQFFVFSRVFIAEKWRQDFDQKTLTALILLLASDCYSIVLLVYLARRRALGETQCAEPFGSGITEPISPLVLVGTFFAVAFVVAWTTWRVFSTLICSHEVHFLIYSFSNLF